MADQQLLTRTGNPLLEAWRALGPTSSYGLTRFNAKAEDILRAAEILELDPEPLREMQRKLARYGSDLEFVGPHMLRSEATVKYSWAIPDLGALAMLERYGPIVEVGAGTGYWASLLAERGVDVVALDLWPAGHPQNYWHSEAGVYHPVQEAPVEAVAQHPDRTLFVCWPPYAPDQDLRMSVPDDPENWSVKHYEFGGRVSTHWSKRNDDPDMALMALLSYEAAGGQRLIYIGEGSGGCTAGPTFHAIIGQGCDHWRDETCACPEPRWREVDECPIPQWDGMHDHLWVYERVVG